MKPLPLYFLPGMMCNELLWRHQIDILSMDREVFVADFSKDATIPAMAKRALDDGPEEFILAGLSMGGIVAFEMWKQAPGRIKGLALLDTNAKGDSEERKKIRNRQIRDARNGLLERILVEELKPNYLAKVHRSNPAILGVIKKMSDGLGLSVFEAQSNALMARADATDILSTISCPTEVLCGKEDQLCPIEYHQAIAAAIPDARLTILPDCGHMSSLEAPSVVNAMLRDLISRVEGS